MKSRGPPSKAESRGSGSTGVGRWARLRRGMVGAVIGEFFPQSAQRAVPSVPTDHRRDLFLRIRLAAGQKRSLWLGKRGDPRKPAPARGTGTATRSASPGSDRRRRQRRGCTARHGRDALPFGDNVLRGHASVILESSLDRLVDPLDRRCPMMTEGAELGIVGMDAPRETHERTSSGTIRRPFV